VLKNSAIVARNLFYCNQIFKRSGPLFPAPAGRFGGGLKSIRLTDDNQMVANVFYNNRLRICGATAAYLMLAGCGPTGFDLTGVLESHPVRLDREQVVLNSEQVDCGTREDLWTISPLGDGRSLGRLTTKGRDLQFNDDVQIGDPAVGVPYVQLHGDFSVKVIQPGSVRDEDEWTKSADAKVAVKIDQSCFLANPPVLMGIRHGQFDQSSNPVFRFKLDGEWLADRVIH
jgi:hypothetical protein